jgi:hypothetical protein
MVAGFLGVAPVEFTWQGKHVFSSLWCKTLIMVAGFLGVAPVEFTWQGKHVFSSLWCKTLLILVPGAPALMPTTADWSVRSAEQTPIIKSSGPRTAVRLVRLEALHWDQGLCLAQSNLGRCLRTATHSYANLYRLSVGPL